ERGAQSIDHIWDHYLLIEPSPDVLRSRETPPSVGESSFFATSQHRAMFAEIRPRGWEACLDLPCRKDPFSIAIVGQEEPVTRRATEGGESLAAHNSGKKLTLDGHWSRACLGQAEDQVVTTSLAVSFSKKEDIICTSDDPLKDIATDVR